jgi:hypothetical protein
MHKISSKLEIIYQLKSPPFLMFAEVSHFFILLYTGRFVMKDDTSHLFAKLLHNGKYQDTSVTGIVVTNYAPV